MFKIFKFNYKSIYLDHAAATPICDEAAAAMQCADKYYANPSAIHKAGMEARNLVEITRRSIAEAINARANEVYFTSSGTESLNLSLVGLTYNWHKENEKKNENKFQIIPKIITTRIEHSATLETLKYLERENMIRIIYLDLDDFGFINLESLKKLFDESGPNNTENILCVSIIYANNETGVVQRAKEIGRIINLYNQKLNDSNKNIIYNLDACQAINYLNINVYNLRCHMMAFNSNKIYGPKGVAALYISKSVKLSPIIYGGEQERGLRSGTENVSGIAGFGAAINIVKENIDNELTRMLNIQSQIIKMLNDEIKEAVIYTPVDNSIVVNQHKTVSSTKYIYNNIKSIPNIINIGLPGMRSDEMVLRLSERGIYVSHKSACGSVEEIGSHVISAIGGNISASNENIRLSMGRDTTMSDMKKCIREIKEIYYKFRATS